MNHRTSSVMAAGLALAATAACQSPVPHGDPQIRYRDGVAQVHAPLAHTAVGVVVLHSLGHDAQEAVVQGWSHLSDRERFVAAYLDRGGSWNAGLCCGGASSSNRGDVTWIRTVVADLVRRYHLKTVYVAGNSNGGMMAERMLADSPATFKTAVVWAGAPEMPAAGTYAGGLTVFDGERDAIVPVLGGTSFIAGRLVEIRPYSATAVFLPDAILHSVIVPKQGHSAAPGWPQIAWRALAGTTK